MVLFLHPPIGELPKLLVIQIEYVRWCHRRSQVDIGLWLSSFCSAVHNLRGNWQYNVIDNFLTGWPIRAQQSTHYYMINRLINWSISGLGSPVTAVIIDLRAFCVYFSNQFWWFGDRINGRLSVHRVNIQWHEQKVIALIILWQILA